MKRSEMIRFINGLNKDEASQALKILLEDDPLLAKKIYEAAMKVTANVDADAVMNHVFWALDMLEMDDLNRRSGRTRYGYVEPCDAAWELFEEALEPFINEMKKSQQRAMPHAAKAQCIGIIKGLWKYEEESSSDIKDWMVDAPGEYIETVVEEWEKGNPDTSDTDKAEVMCAAKKDRQ